MWKNIILSFAHLLVLLCELNKRVVVVVPKFNPLPVQFKSLLHGREGCVFSVGI
jgi:hypothetical protein